MLILHGQILPGILVFLSLVVAAICVGIIWSAARHESEVADKHK